MNLVRSDIPLCHWKWGRKGVYRLDDSDKMRLSIEDAEHVSSGLHVHLMLILRLRMIAVDGLDE